MEKAQDQSSQREEFREAQRSGRHSRPVSQAARFIWAHAHAAKKVWQTHFGGLSIFLALAQAAKSRETGEDFVTRIVI